MMAASASSPSVNAAGPGCRMSGDLISRRKPSRTAAISAKPGRAATFVGTNFLPHQEPMMMSRSEEHTSELQSRQYLVCRLLLEKKKKKTELNYCMSCRRTDGMSRTKSELGWCRG